tara:strand:+ start:283 stop:4752 length:4470 start_codon:yes stop_codon:yes gene_type:complete
MATNTVASFTEHTGNGTAGPFNVSFSYLAESEVDVTVGGSLKTLTTHYTFTSATQITFTSGNEPGNGVAIKFQRDTNVGSKKVDFVDGSVLTEIDLDNNANQLLFSMQEIVDSGAGSSVQSVTGTTPIVSSGGTTPAISISAATTSAAGSMSASDKSKLDGIEASANNYSISSDLLDEDNMASNSATKAASQQSIKAYVDSTNTSENISFTQTGTGAVARTVDAKLKDSINVLDFIPVGTTTASTDCASYFQAAINTGKVVYVPKGSYRIDSTLLLDGSFEALIGDESMPELLKWTEGPAIQISEPGGSVLNEYSRIENFYIQRKIGGSFTCPNYNATLSESLAGVVVSGHGASVASAVQSTRISNLRVGNFAVGFYFADCVSVTVHKCFTQNLGTYTNATQTANGTTITSSMFGVGFYFDATRFGSGSISPLASIEIVETDDNRTGDPTTIKSVSYLAIGQDIRDIFFQRAESTSADFGWYIDGQTNDDLNWDIHIIRPIIDGFKTNGIFATNIDGAGALSITGGYFVGAADASACIYVTNSNGVAVTGGSQLLGLSNNSSSNTDDGVRLDNCSSCLVVGNRFANLQYGVSLNGTSYTTVQGNVISAASTESETAPTLHEAIRLFGNSTFNTVGNNTIRGKDSTHKYSKGINLASGSDNCKLIGNIIDTTTVTTQIDDNASGTEFAGSTNLSATANGTSLTVESSSGNNVSLPAATTSAWGVMSDDQATKLDGIEASADVTDATNVNAAGAVMNSDLDGKGELLVGDGTGDPTALAAGTNGYVLKANSSTATGLEWSAAGSGGDVNQNAFSTIAVSGQSNVAADSATDTLNIAAGSNVTITTDAGSDTVTIASTDTNTTYSVGDGGLTQNNFTDALKNKLDGIAASANVGLTDIVGDTTPQLGGNLDVQSSEITTSTSNGNIKLNPNGTGVVEVKGDGSSADGTLQLNCSQNSHGIKLKSPPHSAGASYTLTFPNTDGNANQVLKTDGSGGLDWVDQASGGATDKISEGNTEAETVDTGSDGHFKVTTEGTERLRVIADGKVGIGTTSPSTVLEVNGSFKAGGLAYPTSDGSANQVLKTDGSGTLSFVDQSGGGGGGITSDSQSNTVGGTGAGEDLDLSNSNTINNTLFGKNAGANIDTNQNCSAFGSGALDALVHTAGSQTHSWQASDNTAVGAEAMSSATIARQSTGIGASALFQLTTGTNNTAVGYKAGNYLTTHSFNVFIGDNAGEYTRVSESVYIGADSGKSNNVSGSNNIVIGKSAEESSTTTSNEITLGNSSITKFRIPGIDFVLKDNGGTPTNGHVLTVDANGEAGFAAASGGGAMTFISTTELSSAASSVIFTGLDNTYPVYKLFYNFERSGTTGQYLMWRGAISGSAVSSIYSYHNIKTDSSGSNYGNAYTGCLFLDNEGLLASGELTFYNIGESGKPIYAHAHSLEGDRSSGEYMRNSVHTGMGESQTGTWNGIQISGIFDQLPSGAKFSLYGIKDS